MADDGLYRLTDDEKDRVVSAGRSPCRGVKVIRRSLNLDFRIETSRPRIKG